jgi:hypothetical protein
MHNQGSKSGHYLFFVEGLYMHGSNRIVQFGFNLGLDYLFIVNLNKAHFTQVVQAKVEPKWINLVGGLIEINLKDFTLGRSQG